MSKSKRAKSKTTILADPITSDELSCQRRNVSERGKIGIRIAPAAGRRAGQGRAR